MDPRFAGLTHIFLDADDTLWENDVFFRRAEDEFVHYMAQSVGADETHARELLAAKQEDNIPIFGYGSKTYLLGMLDAAIALAPGRFDGRMYFDIKEIITRLTTHDFEWLKGAEETVRMLATRYKVVIATKGDLGEQNRKFRQSGLADCVCAVEVMEKKSEADYRNLAAKMGVPTDQFLMVGNAVRSDIAPVIAIGGWAIHIPFRITWAHELMPLPVSDRVLTLTHITQLQPLFL